MGQMAIALPVKVSSQSYSTELQCGVWKGYTNEEVLQMCHKK